MNTTTGAALTGLSELATAARSLAEPVVSKTHQLVYLLTARRSRSSGNLKYLFPITSSICGNTVEEWLALSRQSKKKKDRLPDRLSLHALWCPLTVQKPDGPIDPIDC